MTFSEFTDDDIRTEGWKGKYCRLFMGQCIVRAQIQNVKENYNNYFEKNCQKTKQTLSKVGTLVKYWVGSAKGLKAKEEIIFEEKNLLKRTLNWTKGHLRKVIQVKMRRTC